MSGPQDLDGMVDATLDSSEEIGVEEPSVSVDLDVDTAEGMTAFNE